MRLITWGTSQGNLPLSGDARLHLGGAGGAEYIAAFIEHLPCARHGGLPNSDLTASLQRARISPHSMDEEVEAQGDEVIRPKLGSYAGKQPD